MANKVIECIVFTQNTQILKIADFAVWSGQITQTAQKNDHSIVI